MTGLGCPGCPDFRAFVIVVVATALYVHGIHGGLHATVASRGMGNGNPRAMRLSDWMGDLAPLLGNSALSGLTLPGTHDTLTYDLSTKVSAGAIDGHDTFSLLLRSLGPLVPGSFIRDQAITSTLSVSQQLDAGVRFLDLRLMQEPNKEWFSLHFVQSNQKVLSYLGEIKTWLERHPSEVVLAELTKHGNECAVGKDQYPGVSIDEKRKFWGQITSLFDGLLFDRRVSSMNSTSLTDLVARGHRLILLTADYQEFTDASPLAYDICKHTTWHGPGFVTDVPHQRKWLDSNYRQASARREVNRRTEHLYILGMQEATDVDLVKYLLKLKLYPFGKSSVRKECAAYFNIPGLVSWCPKNLPELTALNNYYKQVTLEDVIQTPQKDFPEVVAIDGIGPDGTWYVGSAEGLKKPTDAARSSFVDVLLLANVQRACSTSSDDCTEWQSALKERIAAHPVQLVEDPTHGRHTSWPESDRSRI